MMDETDPIEEISDRILSEICQTRKRLVRLRTEKRELEKKSDDISSGIDKQIRDIELSKQRGLMRRLGNSRRNQMKDIQDLNQVRDKLETLKERINTLEDDLRVIENEYEMYKD